MDIINNKKTSALTVFAAFVFLAAVFVWIFVLLKMGEKTDAAIVLRRIIAENELKLAETKSIEKILDKIKQEKNVINSVFLNEKDLLRVIEGLESISKSAGADLKISSVAVGGNASKPVFNFSAKGSFKQLFEYFYFLENIPYIITIDKVSFIKTGKRDDSGDSWTAFFDVELESYEDN